MAGGSFVSKLWKIAEDGLDPADGLTAEEALARITVLCALEVTVGLGEDAKIEDLYTVEDMLSDHDASKYGGESGRYSSITALLAWSDGEYPREPLEQMSLIHRWTR